MARRLLLEIAITLCLLLLLDHVVAAPLDNFPNSLLAASHHHLIKRPAWVIPPNNDHPESIVGLPLESPKCESDPLLKYAQLHDDCVSAWSMMEEQPSSLLTAYMGNFDYTQRLMMAALPLLVGLDYLGIPRVYWKKSCIITITVPEDRRTGSLSTTYDIAHKNAIKTAAASIINSCTWAGHSGGTNFAGQEQRLGLYVGPVSEVTGPLVDLIRIFLVNDFDNARVHLNPDHMERSIIEHIETGTNAATGNSRLPYTYCRVGSDQSCGDGIECRTDREGSGDVLKILWGAIISSASCIWSEGGSKIHPRETDSLFLSRNFTNYNEVI